MENEDSLVFKSCRQWALFWARSVQFKLLKKLGLLNTEIIITPHLSVRLLYQFIQINVYYYASVSTFPVYITVIAEVGPNLTVVTPTVRSRSS